MASANEKVWLQPQPIPPPPPSDDDSLSLKERVRLMRIHQVATNHAALLSDLKAVKELTDAATAAYEATAASKEIKAAQEAHDEASARYTASCVALRKWHSQFGGGIENDVFHDSVQKEDPLAYFQQYQRERLEQIPLWIDYKAKEKVFKEVQEKHKEFILDSGNNRCAVEVCRLEDAVRQTWFWLQYFQKPVDPNISDICDQHMLEIAKWA